MYESHVLAAKASTGNNTHAGVECGGVYDQVAVQFVVEAVGATPTVTWKVQGSADGLNWYDMIYITDASDTPAVAAEVDTVVGASIHFLANAPSRKYDWFRLVTSANTNVTYRGELYTITDS